MLRDRSRTTTPTRSGGMSARSVAAGSRAAVTRQARARGTAQRVRRAQVGSRPGVAPDALLRTAELPRNELRAHADRARIDLSAVEEDVDARADPVAEEDRARLDDAERLDAGLRQAASGRADEARVELGQRRHGSGVVAIAVRRDTDDGERGDERDRHEAGHRNQATPSQL